MKKLNSRYLIKILYFIILLFVSNICFSQSVKTIVFDESGKLLSVPPQQINIGDSLLFSIEVNRKTKNKQY